VNCGQTAADSDMVTIDSLYKLIITLSNGMTYHLATMQNVIDDDDRQTDG